MKKLIITLIAIAIYATNTYAQNLPSAQPVSWVVESTVYQPKINTVKFYDDKSQLIYQETIYGKLDVKKKYVREALNQACEKLYAQRRDIKNANLLGLALSIKQ
ncbi:MAG: hypothetical protein WC615_07155 [Mucilaginibacter sp.]|jgi:hypothetical protein|uniref:hypothetical protein n=1 Tax=Mucilaginibacter sp. TaxID=1882438 RepID=UPI00356627EF